jgi:peroxiredoxin
MTALSVFMVLAWVVTLLAAWIGYQMVRNNGQLFEGLALTERTLAEVEEKVEKDRRQAEGLPAGEQAPTFELPDLNGRRVSLEGLRGRRVLLVFFSAECGYCKELAPELARLPWDGREGYPQPVVVTTGGVEANRALVAEHGIRCPVLLQEQTEVATRYRTPGTPVGYLVDESGVIAGPMVAGGPGILALAQASNSAGPNTFLNGASVNGNGADSAAASAAITVANGQAGDGLGHRRGGGLEPGTVAPRFTLPRLDGGRLSLDDYRGRPLLLVFSDPQCGACNVIMPKLEEVHGHAPDLSIVMVSRGEPDANREKVAELGLTFPVVLQRRWDLSRQYRKFATPVAYLIDGNGLIASKAVVGGALLALALEAAQLTSAGRGVS